ncbi:sugar phosphate isomerase/epimerase family protein [Phycicoccus avicenniae]|uniref:sugar phosphate isomerase/epimerase family protein n=1 Tax=Phycicoccus avicenniae TaxID=2828860 RepID=UPI003D2AE08C
MTPQQDLLEADDTARGLVRGLGLNRRQLFAATTGLAAAATLAAPTAASAKAIPRGQVVIPANRRGIILYTVRDAVSRDPATSPYASGFRAVLEELGRIGYAQVEFAGYRQHANAPGGDVSASPAGARLLRRWLDDNGLRAQGNHGSVPSTITTETLTAFDAACEYANVLGLGHIGTGGDPTNSAQRADWDLAADRWNFLGRRAARHGLKLYTHNHDVAYSFLLDRGPKDAAGLFTRSSGKRRLEYFLERTDAKYVFLEMDIYWAHVAKFKHTSYTAADGSTVEKIFNPLKVVQKQPRRFPLFHAKDGDERPDLANGYEMTPFGLGDIDFRTFLSRTGAPRGYAHPMWEQDTAPSTTDPGQSLALAELSYDAMSSLRR